MKRLFLLLAPIVFLSSCIMEDVEPRYDDRDRIVGYYDVNEYSNTYHDMTYYSFRIGKSGYYDEVYIDNFYAADIRIYARVSYNTITIYSQVVNGYEIEGTGTIFGNEIDLNYRVRDRYNSSYTDYCETTATFDY
jgi:hypothetical protein